MYDNVQKIIGKFKTEICFGWKFLSRILRTIREEESIAESDGDTVECLILDLSGNNWELSNQIYAQSTNMLIIINTVLYLINSW